jgi:hypothetical protein
MNTIDWQYIAATTYKPGQTVRASGLYTILDRKGAAIGEERTCVKGEVFPPTPEPGYMYQLAQRAQHKGDEELTDG